MPTAPHEQLRAVVRGLSITWEYGGHIIWVDWEMALMGLQEHLRTPGADPESAGWMAGPEGRDYLVGLMTGCSSEWTQMSIAFGTDPVLARTAGERCAAAYTASPES